MGPLMGPEAHLEWMRHWRRVKVEETAAVVNEIGAQNFILGKDHITTMGREVTGKLLMG
jgi:hypothetical protein